VAQQPGTQKQNFLPGLTTVENGQTLNSKIVLDANWRWIHQTGTYTNCFDSGWNTQFCPDPFSCARNCQLEGVEQAEYLGTYGVSTTGNALTLRYVTNGPYGKNVGSRVYLMNADGVSYKLFNPIGSQLSFDVDVSQLPCGLNGAVYFSEMSADGGQSLGMAGAAFGTGYGDAQCPRDIKYIRGFVNTNNTGICSPEFDIWEANSYATQLASHPCSITNVYPCADAKTCGDGADRYNGVCDKDGASLNHYRQGNVTLYGPGKNFAVDTTRPFTVNTQFVASSSGDLVKIVRTYTQNGKTVDGGYLDDAFIAIQKKQFGEQNHHAKLGGLRAMGQSFKRGVALVLSLWDDNSVNMLWLDSTYPKGGTAPGNKRGPCDPNRQGVDWLRQTYPTAQVIYSNIRVSPLSTPTPTPTPTPFPTPTPTPTPTPDPCNVKLTCDCVSVPT
jgi:cellulose 1,4-beta-cellobiosidase